jgi:hypothetical protein
VTTNWTNEQMDVLERAGEIDIAPLREDGDPGRPTTIWLVRVDNDLYVRSYRGPEGHWYRAATRAGRGRVSVSGNAYAVVLEPAPEIDQAVIDEAYRAKYGRSSYVDAMVTTDAAATTLRLSPAPETQRTHEQHR